MQLNVTCSEFFFSNEKQSQLNMGIVDWLTEINEAFIFCALIQKQLTLVYCPN